MKAVVQERYGSAEMLAVREIGKPVPADGEVLVAVRAAAVNARDWHVMRGDPYIARVMDPGTFGRRGPKALVGGTDFAGVVEAVGPGVRGWEPGDEVFGEAGGAFAEYVCAPQTVLARKPTNLSFEQAAALPLAGNTALMGLRDAADVTAGTRLLINGASGGVGTFAVQLGKAYGAVVTGVCSTKNVELVRSLGADQVVDYTSTDFTQAGPQYDVVLDLVGNHSLTALRRVLVPGGTLVLSGGGVSRGGSLIGPVGLVIRGMLLSKVVRRHRVAVLTAVPSSANLAELATLAESGKVAPVIDRGYPLAETAEAIRYLEVEHARAKVVLTV
ncbi:Alcohol dehydrogenase zinc-binding domain protein [Kribbella flavida DSM 17836]|uniref:Alcohol dehydrogenase zinc-binding domain protein n=1 Tax=Kribbella flavida (strain DSM 17836 / JCM 10339 / NBRC 14399) TaxID=479435 RepID=D2Q3A0_KRIFD|nr:NAD(P)-dependent alcohol dehydrogenase [Kribbella flavida]ADB32225.1 Alcohol dehydrogenase zinc-binding domain protein [Kribbella flavida DSM 17836]